jgi:hypothetical protein
MLMILPRRVLLTLNPNLLPPIPYIIPMLAPKRPSITPVTFILAVHAIEIEYWSGATRPIIPS